MIVFIIWAAQCGACTMSVPSVCALPEVLRGLDTELQRHGTYGTPEVGSIAELTGPDGGSASCAVRVAMRGYDTAVYGNRPVAWIEVRNYSVIRLRNGLMVRLDR